MGVVIEVSDGGCGGMVVLSGGGDGGKKMGDWVFFVGIEW